MTLILGAEAAADIKLALSAAPSTDAFTLGRGVGGDGGAQRGTPIRVIPQRWQQHLSGTEGSSHRCRNTPTVLTDKGG